MSACLHPRRWYYLRARSSLFRPSLIVERCLDCHENPRGEGAFVSHAEVVEAGLFPGLLAQDPWPGGRHA